nr:unnamed protein product [Spirometra erinaceieuropaei]
MKPQKHLGVMLGLTGKQSLVAFLVGVFSSRHTKAITGKVEEGRHHQKVLLKAPSTPVPDIPKTYQNVKSLTISEHQ